MSQPTILILIGITGDLSKRKLLPAIEHLQEKKALPEQFRLVGVSRREEANLFKMDLENLDEYLRLNTYLQDIEKEWGVKAQKLFYLAVAPSVALPIIVQLGKVEIENIKLLLEKPFGLDTEIETYFSAEQVYRIDHYLQKTAIRNFKKISIENVERIEVVASESIDVQGRGSFYEQTGALKDLIQSHLLEVAATIVSPEDRLSALKKFSVPIETHRGQYKGYREQVGNPESTVETKACITLMYEDVKINLKTGKALATKSTDVYLYYKDGTVEKISLNETENAYEHVFLDAIAGLKKQCITREEVGETWRILQPVQEAWKKDGKDLEIYEVGSQI